VIHPDGSFVAHERPMTPHHRTECHLIAAAPLTLEADLAALSSSSIRGLLLEAA
jgi:hypothetical protein